MAHSKISAFVKRHPRLSFVAAALASLWLTFSIIGHWRGGLGLAGDPPDGGSRILVVLLHGLAADAEKMDAVKAEVRRNAKYATADFYQPQYMANPLSNTDPVEISTLLEQKIHELHEAHRYQEIILIGHSMGDLLARNAYLIAADREPPVPWSDQVSRIISLAGINRGWSPDSAVERPNWSTRALWRLGDLIGKLTLSGGMTRSLRKGAPFIANLRLQWMRFVNRREEQGLAIPIVVQIIGAEDDVVSREDSLDLGVSKRFHSFLVPGAGHGSLVRFDDPSFGEALRATFATALMARQFSGSERGYLRDACGPSTDLCRKTRVDPTITEVILIRHGIRDLGDWGNRFQARYRSLHPNDTHVWIDPSSYPRMPLAPFLLFGSRERRVNEFMDDYTQLVAQFPKARRFHFVGHSNGTYLLARAMQKYDEMTINRVVFAGTVTPRAYRWRGLLGRRVDEVLNYVGKDDLVVGIFPRLFELIHELTGLRVASFDQLGSAGYAGYHYRGPGMHRIDGLGGHGWAVGDQPEFDTMISFLKRGGDELMLGAPIEPPGWAEWSSNLCWLLWLALAAFLVGLGKLAVWAASRWAKDSSKRVIRYSVGIGYGVLVAGLLFSI